MEAHGVEASKFIVNGESLLQVNCPSHEHSEQGDLIATNVASSKNANKPQPLAKWRQEEIENQKKLIGFLMTPTKLRGEEEA